MRIASLRKVDWDGSRQLSALIRRRRSHPCRRVYITAFPPAGRIRRRWRPLSTPLPNVLAIDDVGNDGAQVRSIVDQVARALEFVSLPSRCWRDC